MINIEKYRENIEMLKKWDNKKKEKLIFIVIGIIVLTIMSGITLKFEYFYDDWYNHIWMINYYAEYIKSNHNFPNVVNPSNYSIGLTQPLYYGVWFYRLMGVIAALVGSGRNALVLCQALVCMTTYASLYNALCWINRDIKWLNSVISMFAICSTYQMTNFYNRGAITEFFAVNLLLICISSWVCSIFEKQIRNKLALYMKIGLFYGLIVNTHPITAMYGAIAMAIIIAATIYKSWVGVENRNYILLSIGTALIVILVVIFVSPWTYITLAYSPMLSGGASLKFFEGVDAWWIRILPFPIRIESIENGICMETPYLDAQLNFPILCIMIFMSYLVYRYSSKRNKIIILIFNVTTLCIYLCSVISEAQLILPKILKVAQFMFRLVNYIDISMLITIMVCLYFINSEEILKGAFKKDIINVLIFTVTIFICSTSAKELHIYAVGHEYGQEGLSCDRTELFRTFYWGHDYSCIDDMSTSDTRVDDVANINRFQCDSESNFGNVKDIEVKCEKDEEVIVSMLPHPFNYLEVDGKKLSIKDMNRIYNDLTDDECVSVLLGEGEHRIHYLYSPDRIYTVLNYASDLVFVILFMIVGINSVYIIVRKSPRYE